MRGAGRTTTDGAGFFQFTGMRPGMYTLSETQPSGFDDGSETLGTLGGSVANDLFSSIPMAPAGPERRTGSGNFPR